MLHLVRDRDLVGLAKEHTWYLFGLNLCGVATYFYLKKIKNNELNLNLIEGKNSKLIL